MSAITFAFNSFLTRMKLPPPSSIPSPIPFMITTLFSIIRFALNFIKFELYHPCHQVLKIKSIKLSLGFLKRNYDRIFLLIFNFVYGNHIPHILLLDCHNFIQNYQKRQKTKLTYKVNYFSALFIHRGSGWVRNTSMLSCVFSQSACMKYWSYD